MKKIIFLLSLVLATALWLGCSKTDNIQLCGLVPCSELDALTQYIKKDSIDATLDSRGFYYKIENRGSEEKPHTNATVEVNYVGTLTNGYVFDKADNATFNLESLISGWQLGIPNIGQGGKILLYLPPSLGYGSNAVGQIPPNSILIFSITLVNFTNP